jgi:o-succinylbenzoate synthase
VTVLEGIDLHPFRIPMRTRFRGVDHREGVLLEGPVGWGEFSPFTEYEPAYAARWLRSAIEAATTAAPAPVRDSVAVNVTVPAVSPDEARRVVTASGCMTAKVKVAEPGQSHEEDMARVEAVRDALGPAGLLRIDANAAWDVDEAAPRLADLARFDLDYAEQPVATLEEMASLRRRVDVRLAVDEPIRLAEDPIAVARLLRPVTAGGIAAADVAIIKVQPLGGIRTAMEVAEACGLPVVVSSALETSVGLGRGLTLAGALPELAGACGLGTLTLLEGDVTTDPLVPVAGALRVRRPAPDPEVLARWTPTKEDHDRILDRLMAAANAGGAM